RGCECGHQCQCPQASLGSHRPLLGSCRAGRSAAHRRPEASGGGVSPSPLQRLSLITTHDCVMMQHIESVVNARRAARPDSRLRQCDVWCVHLQTGVASRDMAHGRDDGSTPDVEPLRWGVLGVADIAVHKVIPAMQATPLCPVVAIASRSAGKAADAARRLGIADAHGSYESLLASDAVDAVYIPLPNHLHHEWTLAAADAGKHVLCEKPLALT